MGEDYVIVREYRLPDGRIRREAMPVEEWEKAIILAYQDGVKIRQICSRYRVSESVLGRILRKHGVNRNRSVKKNEQKMS